MLLTNTQVSKIRETFAKNSSANINLSKTQLQNIGQSGGFSGRPLEPLLKVGWLLIGNIVKLLAKSVLIPLACRAGSSATDTVIHKKCLDLVCVLRA